MKKNLQAIKHKDKTTIENKRLYFLQNPKEKIGRDVWNYSINPITMMHPDIDSPTMRKNRTSVAALQEMPKVNNSPLWNPY